MDHNKFINTRHNSTHNGTLQHGAEASTSLDPLQGSMFEHANELLSYTGSTELTAAAGEQGGIGQPTAPSSGTAAIRRERKLHTGQPSAEQQCQVKYISKQMRDNVLSTR